ncbi:MAG: ribonuclease D [Myxococcales bacterium]
MGSLIVDRERALESLEVLSRAARLSFDTEGDGLFRYRTRLCMMQLGCAEQVALVDTLAFDALPLFERLLGEQGPEKIVHDASFDARVLFAHGVKLGRVFDTAVAARFLGLKATGLSSLLSTFFQLELPKDKQQADWGARPLDDDAVRYLVDDVCHLEALADLLLARIRELDIEAEVREECAYLLSEAQHPAVEAPPWTRLKGALVRPPAERARLRELFAEREALARELDVPPGRLVPNEVLSKLGERAEVESAQLARLLGPKLAGHLERFEQAFERARGLSDAPEAEIRSQASRAVSPAELERRKTRKRLLTELRTREAALRGVDPQVVLPGHCLSEIVDLPVVDLETLRAVPGFGECRIERYGARMVAELTATWPR